MGRLPYRWFCAPRRLDADSQVLPTPPRLRRGTAVGEPLMASPYPDSAGSVPIPAASGSGVVARLPTATLLLSAPNPHVGQERTLKRAGFAHDGAKGLLHQHRVGVKSQARNPFQKWLCAEKMGAIGQPSLHPRHSTA